MSQRQVFHWHKQSRAGRTSSVAVKQSERPVSIFTNVTINTTGALTTDDSSLTQSEIAAHLGIAKGTVQKILTSCLIVVHNPVGVNFSAFVQMAPYGCAIHPIDLQLGLLLRNTLFFTPAALKDFLHFF